MRLGGVHIRSALQGPCINSGSPGKYESLMAPDHKIGAGSSTKKLTSRNGSWLILGRSGESAVSTAKLTVTTIFCIVTAPSDCSSRMKPIILCTLSPCRELAGPKIIRFEALQICLFRHLHKGDPRVCKACVHSHGDRVTHTHT